SLCSVLVVLESVDIRQIAILDVVFELLFFFFQAEDGIRDDLVTGVQTCALPICTTFHWDDACRISPIRLPAARLESRCQIHGDAHASRIVDYRYGATRSGIAAGTTLPYGGGTCSGSFESQACDDGVYCRDRRTVCRILG